MSLSDEERKTTVRLQMEKAHKNFEQITMRITQKKRKLLR